MALSDIILQAKKVILSSSAPPSDAGAVSGDYAYGYVEKVYETSDKTIVGNTVLYNQKKTTTFNTDGATYLVVDEDDLLFGQPTILPP